jgi:hypothetical protein
MNDSEDYFAADDPLVTNTAENAKKLKIMYIITAISITACIICVFGLACCLAYILSNPSNSSSDCDTPTSTPTPTSTSTPTSSPEPGTKTNRQHKTQTKTLKHSQRAFTF